MTLRISVVVVDDVGQHDHDLFSFFFRVLETEKGWRGVQDLVGSTSTIRKPYRVLEELGPLRRGPVRYLDTLRLGLLAKSTTNNINFLRNLKKKSGCEKMISVPHFGIIVGVVVVGV